MEAAKKRRSAIRTSFTRNFNILEEQLKENKITEARATFPILQRVWAKLHEVDEEIADLMLVDESIDEDTIDKEIATAGEYEAKFELMNVKIQDLVSSMTNLSTAEDMASSHGHNSFYPDKLPKLNGIFDGQLINWLPFWGQFEQIHEDENVPIYHKFRVLVEGTKEGSRPWKIVQSYPPSKDKNSYLAAVNALKERYGREDLLIEVYIREMLSIVIKMAKSEKLNLDDLYDELEGHLRFLEILGVTSGKCAAILCPLLESCLTADFLRAWQRSSSSEEITDPEKRLEKLRNFIKAEVVGEQRISLAMERFGMSDSNTTSVTSNERKPRRELPRKSPNMEIPTAAGLLTQSQDVSHKKDERRPCIFCSQQSHNSVDCFKARDMNLEDKLKIVRNSKCCYLCLKRTHSSKLCRVKSSCPLCDRRHAIILCPKYMHNHAGPVSAEPSTLKSTVMLAGPGAVTTNANLICESSVLLPTLRVLLRGPGGKTLAIRAVFDTAAQRSYILNSTAEKIGYKAEGTVNLFHSLFGGQRTDMTSHPRYTIQLSKLAGGQVYKIEALGQEAICGDLPTLPKGPWINETATCGFDVSNFLQDTGPIELLLGADVAYSMYTGNIYRFSTGSMVGVETTLGWTISGKLPSNFSNTTLGMLTTSMLVEEMSVAELWKLEVLGIEDPAEKKTKAESQAQVQLKFEDSLKVDQEGRYEVGLPWKNEHSPLSTNYDLALKRMESTYKKLEHQGLLTDYYNVFREWIDEGVIEEILPSEIVSGGHYLPHRHVVKPNSTTKIRPVFDASARQKNSPSLNMCLEKGCNLIEQIPALLHQFRLNKIGVIADIRRAFLQIGISPSDRAFLMFLWRDAAGNITKYRHKRVVFGLTSSPFLLGAVIQYHLRKIMAAIETGASKYSRSTIETLLNCFYVDNVVTSFDSSNDVDTFVTQATAVMAAGKFDLRGWECTNLNLDAHTQTSVLGLSWDKKDDTLCLSNESLKIPVGKITKRLIMSAAHKIFDPLGYASPVTLYPRLIIQELWEMKLGWDDEVPQRIQDVFSQWANEVEHLRDMKIPRWIFGVNEMIHWSIHTFCDASVTSYAAAIFLRVDNGQQVIVRLIQSKARVAPKKTTIPRKELLAATIGSRLHSSVRETITMECESYFWSDSSTVIAWLKREENWAPFVANRAKEIRRLTDVDNWFHVPGTLNPADLPSRGCLGKEFVESRWWEGPEWLYLPKGQWPTVPMEYQEDTINEERRKVSSTATMISTNPKESNDWYHRYFSKYNKLVRMVAWVRRFLNNSRSKSSDQHTQRRGPLSLEEIGAAEHDVLRLVQQETFQGVTDSKIAPLKPFEDHSGLIRLKTKISYRPDSTDFRYPILLPKSHPVVTRLIRDIHERECHTGIQGLLAITRERFWILGGRRSLKNVIANCVTCKRYEAKRLEAPTIPLPVDRVREAAAFEVVGVDLTGPIFLKKHRKAWICLFTCAVTRAIHLELLLSLSTDNFLQGFRRFVARRGRPARVYSDQGTNFVGANNLFEKIEWNKVLEFCEVRRISWRFNPPTAAWWGGWWERLVGLTKRLLRKVLGRSVLSYFEMTTVLCDCESVLNSRPLTFIAEGDSEAIPITPSMFIQDIRESGMPELDVIESVDLKKTVQRRLKLKENFRDRFRNEYLGQLQMRSRTTKHDKLKIGDVVLIGNDGTKRIDWPLARVIELLPGKDGTTRLVRLQTTSGTGTCLRPIQRLYPFLEVDISTSEDDSSGANLLRKMSQDRPELLSRAVPQPDRDSCSDDDPPEPQDRIKKTASGRTIIKPLRFCD